MGFSPRKGKNVSDRLADMLFEIFGKEEVRRSGRDSFAMRRGSAFVRIRAVPFADGRTAVCVSACVVSKASFSEELMVQLLSQNVDNTFGAFGAKIREDGLVDIYLRHDIIADTLDEGELENSVDIIADAADRFDDELVARYGGLRMKDIIEGGPLSWQ